jgi:hypothetical protein
VRQQRVIVVAVSILAPTTRLHAMSARCRRSGAEGEKTFCFNALRSIALNHVPRATELFLDAAEHDANHNIPSSLLEKHRILCI